MPADSDVAERTDATKDPVAISTRAAVVLVLILIATVVYVIIGFAYAASVSYETPGGNWLETLLNWGIRVIGWPILLATHQ